MPDIPSLLQEHQEAIGWLAALSGFVFVGSLILLPWIVVHIPADYFVRPQPTKTPFSTKHPFLHWGGIILKNLVGLLLIQAGIAMLLLPGQGLLAIAIGILLLNLPGKRKLQAKIIRLKPVWKSVAWIRQRAHVPPLIVAAQDPQRFESRRNNGNNVPPESTNEK